MVCPNCHSGYMLLIKYPGRWRKCDLCRHCVEVAALEPVAPESPSTRVQDPQPGQRDFESDSDLG